MSFQMELIARDVTTGDPFETVSPRERDEGQDIDLTGSFGSPERPPLVSAPKRLGPGADSSADVFEEIDLGSLM